MQFEQIQQLGKLFEVVRFWLPVKDDGVRQWGDASSLSRQESDTRLQYQGVRNRLSREQLDCMVHVLVVVLSRFPAPVQEH
jgi:hypothetical protein